MVYILKFAACLTMFVMFYVLLLSRETFHRSNRITILAIMLLSAVIPLVEHTAQAGEPLYAISAGTWDLPDMLTEELPAGVQAAGGAASAWLALAYIAGATLFLLHNIMAVLKIRGIMRSGVRRRAKGLTLILTQWPVPPFSWFSNVVIHPADLAENGEAIIAHERAHVELRHSLDMAAATLCVALQWFNPAAWILMRELRNVHEYEADEQVLKQGVDAKSYQLLLISKAVGRERFTAVASSLRNNKIKKRITMMLKNRSNVVARLKYACILPLSVLAIAVFARPEVAASLEVISNVSVPGLFVPAGDTIAAAAPQQADVITAEVSETVETAMEHSFSHDMDVQVEVDDVVTVVDSIRESVRVVQHDDTVIVTVNKSVDTIIVSANPEVEAVKREARELRRRAVREGVKVSRELDKWRDEHADEIEAVRKQAEALGRKAAAETRKALKEADKARKEIAKEWKDERARQLRADSLRIKRERDYSLRGSSTPKRRVETERRREELNQRQDEAARRREDIRKEREKAEPARADGETDLRETTL